jgi:hypothetical protein
MAQRWTMARLAATVTEETVERLRALAAQYGFIARAGRYIGEPSISELLDAIGDGRFAVVPGEEEMAFLSRSAIKMIEASGRLMENVFLTVEDMPREEWQARLDEEVELYAKAMDEASRLMAAIRERPRQAPLPLGEESDVEATDEED